MAEVVISLFGLIGTIVASRYAYLANHQARRSGTAIDEINDAVNHRHEAGTPRLYDMVLSNFNRVDSLENSVAEIKQDVKQLSHVAKVHQSEIDKIEQQMEND